MDPKEFQKRLEKLRHAFDTDPVNTKGHNLKDCTRCTNCVFCEDCDRCYRCSYSRGCSNSTNLTNCLSCSGCHHLSNSVECESCTNSAFVYMSRDLTECNYCFGCVGLSRKDFHILNERHDRSSYFKIVTQLTKTLRLPKP